MADEPAGITWDQFRYAINMHGQEHGEWSGLPMPVSGIPLSIEPRYPYSGLDGFCFGPEATDAPRSTDEIAGDLDSQGLKVVNYWYSHEKSATVYVIADENDRRSSWLRPEYGGARCEFWVRTIGASAAWSPDAEFAALEALGGLVTKTAYRTYILTGSFLETSKRSGVTYMFRKLRPTVAMKNGKILACLCLHPIGYYQGTWAGCMVPTDDVIAHLMMMRGCEAKFWAKANHQQSWMAESGL